VFAEALSKRSLCCGRTLGLSASSLRAEARLIKVIGTEGTSMTSSTLSQEPVPKVQAADLLEVEAASERQVGFAGWYTLVVLTIVYMLGQVDRKVISIVSEPIKHELGLSDGQLGALTGLIFGMPNALMLLPMGLLIDRANRRNLSALMLGLWSAACTATGFAANYPFLMIARAAVGASEASNAASGLSMIADIFPARLHPVATALYQSAIPTGAIVCFTVIAWVGAEHGWRAAFIAAGVPGIVVTVLMFLTVHEPRRGVADTRNPAAGSGNSPARTTLGRGFRFVIENRVALHYIVGPAMVSSASSGIMLWLPSFLIRSHGMSVAQAGYLLAMTSGVVTAVAMWVSGPATSWFTGGDQGKLAQVPIFTVAATIVFAAIFLLAQPMPLIVIGLCLFAASNYLYLSVGYTLLLGVTPAGMRGTVLSIELIAANLLGYAGGPFLVGMLSDAIGGRQPLRWALVAVLTLYGWGLAHLWLGRRALLAREPASAA
jgi:MFS family permease